MLLLQERAEAMERVLAVELLHLLAAEGVYGAQVANQLNASDVWAAYRDQKHDLFLPAGGTAQVCLFLSQKQLLDRSIWEKQRCELSPCGGAKLLCSLVVRRCVLVDREVYSACSRGARWPALRCRRLSHRRMLRPSRRPRPLQPSLCL